MAGQDKILWSLSLEGAEDVSKKLKAAGDVGDAAAKRLKQSFAEVGQGSSGPPGFKSFQDGAEAGESGAHRLREAIHVLHPILEEAGLGLGNLGAFARLAGAGMGALGVAIVGSLVIGLAKISEESERAGLRLKALGVSGDTFEKLKQQAKELGTSTENLVPSFEKFAASKNKISADQSSGLIRLRPNGATEADQAAAGVRVLGSGGQETGAQVPDSVFLGAQKALIEGAQGEKLSGDDAGKIADAFASKLLENRKLTPEAVDTLNPASQNILAKSLSSFFGTDLSNGAELKERLARPGQQAPSDREVFRSLNQSEPDAAKQAQAAKGVTAGFEAVGSSAKRLAEAFSGQTSILNKSVGGLATLLNEAADKKKQIDNDKLVELPTPDGKPRTDFFSNLAHSELGRDPVGVVKRYLTDPGSFQERQRPESGPSSLGPQSEASPSLKVADLGTAAEDHAAPIAPPKNEFQYIPPPSLDQQRRLDQDRLQPPLAPSSQPPPPNTPVEFGQANSPGDDATRKVSDLGTAAEEAAAKLRGVEAPAEQPTAAHAATGGHIRGPGTSTSDSIPAMLSDGEYVVKADAVQRMGVDKLDAINAGHYADGGTVVKLGPDGRPDNDESGVIQASDGNYYPYHTRAEKDEILRAIDKANQDAQSGQGKKKKHHSLFTPDNGGAGYALGGLVGHFAGGGPVGAASPVTRLQHYINSHFADGGMIEAPFAHLAIGGMPKLPSADLSKSSLGSSSLNLPHHGTTDLRTDHGLHRVIAHDDTLRNLSRAAQSARRYSTGSKPSWYGGNGG